MEELGFGPTRKALTEMVADYVLANEIITNFSDDKPGYDWLQGFMHRHGLALKKGGVMQIARKNVTSDPFVIYGFYDLLESEIERLGIRDRPECFWNLDETGFPSDPSKCKVVGSIGRKCIRVTCGANRENTTVLAVCCADGTAMDPLVIFKGKNLQSTWRGSHALPHVFYGVSESGWMTAEIFQSWFTKFVENTKHIRPLLLVFDGHMAHLSIETAMLAHAENISLPKLPPHCTDVLQPLDVGCFAPLKSYYQEALTAHVQQTGGNSPLRKATFVDMLCKIWKKGLSGKNIKAGFSATGIFPMDAGKYKISQLDKVKLRSYQLWKDAACPTDENGFPLLPNNPTDSAATVQPPSTTDASSTATLIGNLSKASSDVSSPCEVASSSSQNDNDDTVRSLVKRLQSFAPPGMKYVVSLVPADEHIPMETIIKSRGRTTPSEKSTKKRHRISMNAAVISSDEYLKKIEEAESQKKLQQQKKTNRGQKRKALQMCDSSSEENETEVFEEKNNANTQLPAEPSKTEEQQTSTQDMILTKSNVGSYYAVFWNQPRT